MFAEYEYKKRGDIYLKIRRIFCGIQVQCLLAIQGNRTDFDNEENQCSISYQHVTAGAEKYDETIESRNSLIYNKTIYLVQL